MRELNEKLVAGLLEMDDLQFQMLDGRIRIANFCRQVMKKYSIDDVTMAGNLNLTNAEFELFKRGAFEYKLSDLWMLEAIQEEHEKMLISVRVQKPITFPDFKYSRPFGDKNADADKKIPNEK